MPGKLRYDADRVGLSVLVFSLYTAVACCVTDRTVLVAAVRVHGTVCTDEWLGGRLPQLSRLDNAHDHSKTLHLLRSVCLDVSQYYNNNVQPTNA